MVIIIIAVVIVVINIVVVVIAVVVILSVGWSVGNREKNDRRTHQCPRITMVYAPFIIYERFKMESTILSLNFQKFIFPFSSTEFSKIEICVLQKNFPECLPISENETLDFSWCVALYWLLEFLT